MPAGAQHLQRRNAAIGSIEQIGEDDHQRAPAGFLGGEVERRRQERRTAPLRAVENLEQLLHVGRRGSEGEELAHSLPGAPVPRDAQAHLVALPREQVRERAGADGGVLELGHRAAPVRHAAARVDHQERAQVRLHLEALDVVLVELGKRPPVDVADLVARRVFLVLGELHGLTVVGALVQPGEHAFHHLARRHLERAEPREQRRQERLRGCHAFVSRKSSAITRRESTPSASAWKFVSTRWRRTGSASARTSCTSAAGRP